MPSPHPPDRPANRSLFWLVLLFFISLPFVNPWVRGDGVGYYAYVRAPLISHNLDFRTDWLRANTSFTAGRQDGEGNILESEYTPTGHLDNHFSVGPAILWSPFLLAAHGFVKAADWLGFAIPPDGFSRPYRIAMALSTALYGFAALLLAFDLARKYFGETWAFLATLAIWFASSLPVYMYFNPSWSHAQSAFGVGLVLWYSQRTPVPRSSRQWIVLGLIGGLMIDIYYLNAIFLLVTAWEAASSCRFAPIARGTVQARTPLAKYVLFTAATVFALTPTFITRWIVYGSPLASGYPPFSTWSWTSPKILAVLFSADHGMLSWTPVLLLALAGLLLFSREQKPFGPSLIVGFAVFLYCVASFTNWNGLSSFGNRFFISFTPVFVVGLAAFFEKLARWLGSQITTLRLASVGIALLIAWNFGLMLQWGTQMIPARGAISWPVALHNQIAIVPKRAVNELTGYFANRSHMMEQIEKRDMAQQQETVH
jgi:hypothetical protein